MKPRIRGLYALTPDLEDTAALLGKIRAALSGGAGWVQYRNKGASAELGRSQARALRALCRQFEVPLIVNDNVELAAETGAEGVHLGAEDGDPRQARARLGSSRIIGVSCYDSLERAVSAQDAGADYVAFGSFFGSPTKPGAVSASLDLLGRARQRLSVPIVAIGGITPANARPLLDHGADALAVISALFAAEDVAAAARQFAGLFSSRPNERGAESLS